MMIKNTPNDCMGNKSLITKFWIAIKLLQNFWVLFFDKLGWLSGPMYFTRSGIKFVTRGKTTDINDAVVVLSGHEYPKELLGLDKISKPAILDLGGHIGTFALYVKNLFPDSKIISFEPVKSNQDLYLQNIKLNHIQDVTLIPKAVYSAAGNYFIDLSNKQYDAVSVQSHKPAHEDYIAIQAVTFEDVVSKYMAGSIHLLKMDIEGGEYQVLPTSIEIISKTVKRLIMEFHPAGSLEHRNQLVELFEKNNWELIYETKNILGFENLGFYDK